MKRFIILTLIAVLVVSTFPPAVSAKTPYVTVKQVALKQSASTKAKTLITIPKGKTVTHLSDKGSWSNVQYGKQKGFVAKRDIQKQTAAPKPVAGIIPAPAFGSFSYFTYKGGDIVSMLGKTYKIDAPLLPFFKKHAPVFKTVFGIPVTDGNVITGFKAFYPNQFYPGSFTLDIDKAASERIETFVISVSSHLNPTIVVNAASPVTQVTTAGSSPYQPGTADLRLNGTFRQVAVTGTSRLSGKATIERVVLRMGDFYPSPSSYIAQLNVNGTINHLESTFADAQVTLGRSTVVKHVIGVSSNQILDGAHGLIKGTKPAAVPVRGRWMNPTEQQMSAWLMRLTDQEVDVDTVASWLRTLKLTGVEADRLPSYKVALTKNARAYDTRVSLATAADWQRIIDDVNRALRPGPLDRPYVMTTQRSHLEDLILRHDRSLVSYDTSKRDDYQRELIGLIDPSGQLIDVAFKRTFGNQVVRHHGAYTNGDFATEQASYQESGTYRHVSLVGSSRHHYTFNVTVNGRESRVTHVNGKTLSTYKKTPPRVEVKRAGEFLLVRSSDSLWMDSVQQAVAPNAAYFDPRMIATYRVPEAGAWNGSPYYVLYATSYVPGRKLVLQAYGYDDAVITIP